MFVQIRAVGNDEVVLRYVHLESSHAQTTNFLISIPHRSSNDDGRERGTNVNHGVVAARKVRESSRGEERDLYTRRVESACGEFERPREIRRPWVNLFAYVIKTRYRTRI